MMTVLSLTLLIGLDIIRKTFYDGGVDEVISTRRLVHIVQTFNIFGDKMKSIQVCLNRFDDETKRDPSWICTTKLTLMLT